MEVNSQRSLVFGLCAALSALGACSKDTTIRPEPDAGGDGDGDGDQSGDGDGDGDGDSSGDGDGDGDGDGVADLDDGVVGEPCRNASDCGGTNAVCSDTIGGIGGFGGVEAPGGYCSGECTDDSNCGAGGVCIGAIGAVGVAGDCALGCSDDDDCTRSGYECAPAPSLTGNGDMICQPTAETDQLEDGVVGQACRNDRDCPGGSCRTTLGQTFGMGGTSVPGGYCSGDCTEDSQCGENGVCLAVFSFGNQTRTCYLECGAACTRDGFACEPISSGGGGGGGGQIPTACLPENVDEEDSGMPPESDGGLDASTPDGGASDAGTSDASTPDSGALDASADSGA